ncbi:hypothetical protein THASP1DRAFT_29797 [Thamnocephalis sphaerospora]|uniref:DUF3533 domain-containing protein n=1 Tax=Thamnocephalis sphaerospora TaxID=78915 RepID=A0A4P9XR48_9FUNG|nr:hypothetical protein THASP1DRAFT_29797 [Thamnocephalis sphaerospora]|eukprot:RKP08392.1 hypothetical protein THASP1DRAFT_29797 [Thamnocephalis sphaerospora]
MEYMTHRSSLSKDEDGYSLPAMQNELAPPAGAPEQLKKRRFVLQHLLNSRLIAIFVVCALLAYAYTWLYIAALWNPPSHFDNVEVALLNADRGFDFSGVPDELRAMVNQATGGRPLGQSIAEKIIQVPKANFGWKHQPDDMTRSELEHKVDHGTYATAILIPDTFSQDFLSAFRASAAANRTGDAAAANQSSRRQMYIEYMHDQGRNYGGDSVITEVMRQLVAGISSSFAGQFLSSPHATQFLTAMDSEFWITPIQLTNTVLHPVHRYGQNFATYICLVTTFIGCMAIVIVVRRYIAADPGVDLLQPRDWNCSTPKPAFTVKRVVFAKYLIAFVGFFMVSLLIWSVPMSLSKYQADGAPSVAALFYLLLVACCFGSLQNLLCGAIGVDEFPLFGTLVLIIFFTTSSGIITDDLSGGFYYVGHALPFYYAVRGLRYIYFGSLEDKMWINCVVLVAWTLVPVLLSVAFSMRRTIRHRQQVFGEKSQQPVA